MSNEEFEKALSSYAADEHIFGSLNLIRRIGKHFYDVRQSEIDALEIENRRLSDSLEAIDLDTKILVDEIDALKSEVERLRKPLLPPWSPDYGSGPITPDRIYQYFSDGAWYDCSKMDLGFYIADNVPIRELFTRPSASPPTPPAPEVEPEIDALTTQLQNEMIAVAGLDATVDALKKIVSVRDKNIDALITEVARLRESGRKIIADHTQRTKEAIQLQQSYDGLRKAAENALTWLVYLNLNMDPPPARKAEQNLRAELAKK